MSEVPLQPCQRCVVVLPTEDARRPTCVCVSQKGSVCVCVCVWERERVCVRVGERECVCACGREREGGRESPPGAPGIRIPNPSDGCGADDSGFGE